MKRIKLKQFRIGYDLSQKDMATRCGISRQTYSCIEMGSVAGSDEFWLKLKAEFKLSPDEVWIMRYEGRE